MEANSANTSVGQDSGLRRLPEHQFSYWLLREAFRRLSGWFSRLYRSQPFFSLASFSRDFGQCLKSGLPVDSAFEKCRLAIDARYLRNQWERSTRRIQNGETIAKSMDSAESALPRFYLPTIDAGEQCGRVEEAFGFLEKHLRLIQPLSDLLRKLWLYPLMIILSGTLVRSFLLLGNGSFNAGLGALSETLWSFFGYFALAAILWLTPLRLVFDEFRLRLPWVRELEHDLAVCRFFSVMALLERSQSERVDFMIRVAAKTVSNQSIARQLLQAAEAIERQETMGDAFTLATYLDDEVRSTIRSAEQNGTYLESYEHLASQAEHRLCPVLKTIHDLSTRIIYFLVTLCLLGEILRLAF